MQAVCTTIHACSTAHPDSLAGLAADSCDTTFASSDKAAFVLAQTHVSDYNGAAHLYPERYQTAIEDSALLRADTGHAAMRPRATEVIADISANEAHCAEDALANGIVGMAAEDEHPHFEYGSDRRFACTGVSKKSGTKNPLSSVNPLDLREINNLFKRRGSAHQKDAHAEAAFAMAF